MAAQTGYIGGKVDSGYWMKNVRKGIEWRKKCAYEGAWPLWRGYYRNNWAPDLLGVNLYFRMVRSMVPRIYFRNPAISVLPTKPGLESYMLSQIVERVDNSLIRGIKIKKQIKRMIQHAFFFGTGIGKLGFGAQFQADSDLGSIEPPLLNGGKRRVEYHQLIQGNMPWFLAVHPQDFIVPEGCAYFEEAPWFAYRMWRPLADLQADPRFKNVRGKDTGSNVFAFADMKKHDPTKVDMVELFEVHDLRYGTAHVIAPGLTDRVLYEGEDGMFLNNRAGAYPLVFNEDDEWFWGLPDAKIIELHQKEISEIRTLQMKHRRISLFKLLYTLDAADPDELEKMVNGEPGVGIQVKDLAGIKAVQVGDIPEALFRFDRVVLDDVRETMGFSENQWGNFSRGSGDRTKYEAEVVNEAVQFRMDERRDMVADLLGDVLEDANSLIFTRWQDEQVGLVVGKDGMPVWVAFTPQMIKDARYEVNIEAESSIPDTRDIREAKALKLYELLKTNPLVDEVLLSRFIVHELKGVNYDHLLKRFMQAASSGAPGASPEQPLQMGQYLQAGGVAPFGG